MSTPITATAILSAYVAGGAGFLGTSPLYSSSLSNTNGAPPGSAVLATGFNSIPVPSTAAGVVIVPPSGSTTTLTIKGLTGDTGLPIAPSAPFYWNFTAAGAQATIGILAGAAVTVTLIWV